MTTSLSSDPTVTDHRAELITGLRALADFYEANPTMPVPAYPALLVLPDGPDDAAEAQMVREAAELLGVDVKVSRREHTTAERQFASLRVRVCAVPARVRAQHDAHMSYADNVQPADGTR